MGSCLAAVVVNEATLHFQKFHLSSATALPLLSMSHPFSVLALVNQIGPRVS